MYSQFKYKFPSALAIFRSIRRSQHELVAQLPRSMWLTLVPAEKSAPQRLRHALRTRTLVVWTAVLCVRCASMLRHHGEKLSFTHRFECECDFNRQTKKAAQFTAQTVSCKQNKLILPIPWFYCERADFHSPLHFTHDTPCPLKKFFGDIDLVLHSKVRKANETIKRPTDFHIITL